MRWYNPTEEQRLNWRRNVLNLPVEIQRLAQNHPPWNLYRMKSTGQSVYVTSIAENGKFRVTASEQHNVAQMRDESLVQIDPDDLEHVGLLVAASESAIANALSRMELTPLGEVYYQGQLLSFLTADGSREARAIGFDRSVWEAHRRKLAEAPSVSKFRPQCLCGHFESCERCDSIEPVKTPDDWGASVTVFIP